MKYTYVINITLRNSGFRYTRSLMYTNEKRERYCTGLRYSGCFRYSVNSSSWRVPDGTCILNIAGFDNGVCCIIITEDKDNLGPSVTNTCDRIAAQVHKKYLSDVPENKTVWLAYCPANRHHKAYLDLVQFRHEGPEGAVFSHPQWKRFLEDPVMLPGEFILSWSGILKNFCHTSMVFAVQDKKGYYWRVWSNKAGFFIVSSNPAVPLPKELLDLPGVESILNENRYILGRPEVIKSFRAALMKGFLNGKL